MRKYVHNGSIDMDEKVHIYHDKIGEFRYN